MKLIKMPSFFNMILLYFALPAYVVYTLLGSPFTGIDDAVIFFKYARNFAQGHGIVYNIGGEHVEGFTSILYFLICSVFYSLSSHPEKLIFAYNFLIMIGTSLLMLKMIQRLCETSQASMSKCYILYGVYCSWLLMSPFYYAWTVVSLMDVATYGFLLTLTYTYLVSLLLSHVSKHQESVVSILISLILLCRPEGILWGIVYLVSYYGVSYQQEKNYFVAVKKLCWPAVSYVSTLAVLTLFRELYFGYPLPNTYYAKVSSSLDSTLIEGWGYFLDYVDLHGFIIFLPMLLLLGYLFLKTKNSSMKSIAIITLFFISAGLMIPILEGGDHFNGFRLYQNIYPFLILPFILLLIYQASRLRYLVIIVLCFSTLLFYTNNAGWRKFKHSNTPHMAVEDVRMRSALEYFFAQDGLLNGARLNDIFQNDLPSIGFAAAGGFPYAYNGFVYDVLGLNSTQFAHADKIKEGFKGHQSFNKNVLLTLVPDIFIPTTLLSAERINLKQVSDYFTNVKTWDNFIFKNVFNDPKFKDTYKLASIYNTSHPMYQCYGYFSTVYLIKIKQNKNFRINVYG